MSVQFYFHETASRLSGRMRLKKFIKELFANEGSSLSAIRYVFCTDAYLLNINQTFLHHDTYTDIITFDLSEESDSLIGEVYISMERVKDNAEKFGASFEEELCRVIFHGALHLCGYKDKQPAERKRMKQMEDKYLALYLNENNHS